MESSTTTTLGGRDIGSTANQVEKSKDGIICLRHWSGEIYRISTGHYSSHLDEEYDPLLHDGKGETLRLLTNTTGTGDYGGWPQQQQQSRRRRMDPLLIRDDDDQVVHGVPKHQVSCTRVRFVCALVVVVVASASVVLLNHSSISALGMSLTATTTTTKMALPHLWGRKHTKDEETNHDDETHGNRVAQISQWMPPAALSQCEWVMDQFHQRDLGSPPDDLRQRYLAQSVDLNIFYRATAHLFWQDFAKGAWGANLTGSFLLDDDTAEDDDSPATATFLNGAPLVDKNLWTWITGDQHLSNFGAWQNRHGDIVFGVNDIDEAAIFDFQIDILRIAVSIGSHAITNGFSKRQVNRALDQNSPSMHPPMEVDTLSKVLSMFPIPIPLLRVCHKKSKNNCDVNLPGTSAVQA
jgi:Uncharacterized protein conserved in bacteria (DUF2252)